MLEFLLGQYCSSDDEEIVEDGVIDDVEVTSIRAKSVSDRIIPLKISDDRLILRTTADIEVDGNAIIIDEDRSVWDPEDREYFFTAYSNIFFKKATAEVEFDVEISIDSEEGYSFIDVEQVKPNVMYNIELDIDWENITFYDVDLDMEGET